jgi:hypothetical protein
MAYADPEKRAVYLREYRRKRPEYARNACRLHRNKRRAFLNELKASQ